MLYRYLRPPTATVGIPTALPTPQYPEAGVGGLAGNYGFLSANTSPSNSAGAYYFYFNLDGTTGNPTTIGPIQSMGSGAFSAPYDMTASINGYGSMMSYQSEVYPNNYYPTYNRIYGLSASPTYGSQLFVSGQRPTVDSKSAWSPNGQNYAMVVSHLVSGNTTYSPTSDTFQALSNWQGGSGGFAVVGEFMKFTGNISVQLASSPQAMVLGWIDDNNILTGYMNNSTRALTWNIYNLPNGITGSNAAVPAYANITMPLMTVPSPSNLYGWKWVPLSNGQFILSIATGSISLGTYNYLLSYSGGAFTLLDTVQTQTGVTGATSSYVCDLGGGRVMLLSNQTPTTSCLFDISGGTFAAKEFEFKTAVSWAAGHPASGKLITYQTGVLSGAPANQFGSVNSYTVPIV